MRRMTADWLTRYNKRQPHESLGNLTPKKSLMAEACHNEHRHYDGQAA
jgi:transposase InsO family protein